MLGARNVARPYRIYGPSYSSLRYYSNLQVLVYSYSNFAELLTLAMCSRHVASPRLTACQNMPPALRVVNIDVTGQKHAVRDGVHRREIGYRMVVDK